MIGEVYDALLEAGAGEEKARRAAEVLANYDSRFNHIEGELVGLKAEVQGLRVEMQTGFTRLDARIDTVESSLGNLRSQFQGGFNNVRAIASTALTVALANLALTAALFVKLFY